MRSLICASLLVAAACGGTVAASAPTASPSWTLDPSHMFRASPGMPSGTEACRDESAVASLLADFAAAVNSGDARAIRSTLSSSFWRVFINAAGISHVAYSREDAVALLVHRSGERLEFGRPQVSGLEAWDGAAHFMVPVVLQRRDSRIDLNGRGALYCSGSARGVRSSASGRSSAIPDDDPPVRWNGRGVPCAP